MNQVKFSVFADLHHKPESFFTEGPRRLEQIRQRAVDNAVDFVIHCGDLTHGPTLYPDIIAQYAAFPMPTYHVMGNHEFEKNTHEQAVQGYGLEKGYYFFDCHSFRMIVLDFNQYRDKDGTMVLHSMWNAGKAPGAKAGIDDEQFAWLEDAIFTAPGPCVLFSHHGIDRIHGGIAMADLERLWELFRRANREKQRVMMAINGHYHRDFLHIFENVVYFDLNSASYDWVDPAHDRFPQELVDKYPAVKHQCLWLDPIHAIVTLSDDGTVKIDGMKSEFFMGVNRAAIGQAIADSDGRYGTAEVLSASFRLDMSGKNA